MIRIVTCPVGLLQANCYLAFSEETKRGFLVDPGGMAEKISRFVTQYGMKPEAILLTHGHFDHIAAADKLRCQYGVPVLAGLGEERVLGDPLNNLSGVYTLHAFTLEADRLLSDGEELSVAGYRIRTIRTPGHSEGGVCYELPEEGILFSGDTLFQGSYGRVDGPDGDPEEMFRSLTRLFNELPGDTRVLPGHGGETSIEEERLTNPALLDLTERDYI